MKRRYGNAEAFKYDGIKVEFSEKEKKKLQEIRVRNGQLPPDNGNGGNQYFSSGTLPYIQIGKDIYNGVRDKWMKDLLEGITDV